MNYFRNNYAALNSMRILLVIFALIAVASPITTMLILRQDKKVLIMDTSGTFHLVPAQSFRDAKKLHLACAKMAAVALLTRGPDGVLYPELLEQAFIRNTEDWLRNHFEETRTEFELKKIRQTAEVQKIKILDQGNGRYVAHVKAYLTRGCEYGGVRFVETAEAILTFGMVENPDISANGRHPLVVMQVIRFEIRKQEEKK